MPIEKSNLFRKYSRQCIDDVYPTGYYKITLIKMIGPYGQVKEAVKESLIHKELMKKGFLPFSIESKLVDEDFLKMFD